MTETAFRSRICKTVIHKIMKYRYNCRKMQFPLNVVSIHSIYEHAQIITSRIRLPKHKIFNYESLLTLIIPLHFSYK